MKSKVFSRMVMALSMVMAFNLMPQQANAQLSGLIKGVKSGVKAAKGAKAKSTFEPLKEKALEAVQSSDLEYLMSEECRVDLPAAAQNLTGAAAIQDWSNLYSQILGVFYARLHTIEQGSFCENVADLMDKAKTSENEQMKALYVDAAIGVMKAMITNNYDVEANRAAVDAAYESIKVEWDKLPGSYKPVSVPENASVRDPRYLHNLTGGIPDADFIISYQAKIKQQQAEAQAKKEADAAAEKEQMKAMFERGSSSCSFYINQQKAGTANLEKVDIINISSGSSSISINEKGGTSSIGKFVRNGDEYEVYKGSSLIGYISDEWKFYDRSRNYIGYLTTGGYARDKNGNTLGEVSSSTVKLGSSYKWNASGSISTKLFPAAVFLFFNNEFSSFVNKKDYYL